MVVEYMYVYIYIYIRVSVRSFIGVALACNEEEVWGEKKSYKSTNRSTRREH